MTLLNSVFWSWASKHYTDRGAKIMPVYTFCKWGNKGWNRCCRLRGHSLPPNFHPTNFRVAEISSIIFGWLNFYRLLFGVRLSSILVEVVFHFGWGRLLFWVRSSSILVFIYFDHLPYLSSSILVVSHFGRLPFSSSSISVIFHFGCLPFWSSSIFVVFHFGRLIF